jgi:hypothetical protein
MKTFAILGFWIAGVIAVASAGFQPNPYVVQVRGITTQQPYPINNVLIIIAMMTVFALICYMILRPATYKRNWGRALICAGLALLLLILGLFASMHAPLHIFMFQGWTALAVLGLLTLTILSYSASRRVKQAA